MLPRARRRSWCGAPSYYGYSKHNPYLPPAAIATAAVAAAAIATAAVAAAAVAAPAVAAAAVAAAAVAAPAVAAGGAPLVLDAAPRRRPTVGTAPRASRW